jgi:DNA modification methylase
MKRTRKTSYHGNGWNVSTFIEEFIDITGLRPAFDEEYRVALEELVKYLRLQKLRSLARRRQEFLAHVNWKFRLNAEPLGRFYAEGARFGFTFNYHQKCLIQRAFDLSCRESLITVLNERAVPQPVKARLLCLFTPIATLRTLEHLASECKQPTKLRNERNDRDIESEIIKAQFSAFMWVSLAQPEMHRFFDKQYSTRDYRESFWEQMLVRSPKLFSRDNALHMVRINQDTLCSLDSATAVRGAISTWIERSYEIIDNYGFLAILIDPIVLHGRSLEWEIAADASLFAEKHRESPLEKAYFRWQYIRDRTAEHIPGLDTASAHFELVNEGFTYRDCFVLASPDDRVCNLLLVFQKNERDETPIPCPTCRSSDVQGNSYPSLGVRSWECNNVLCPDRSKYNRGKRYSFRGLLMQQAIDDERNEISKEHVRRWARDVVFNPTDNAIAEMLVRHYSIHGDHIHAHNWPDFECKKWGRHVIHHDLQLRSSAHRFWSGPFFRRYATKGGTRPIAPLKNLGDDDFQVLCGDAAAVLRRLPKATFDGAVTSPPYYNARSYSQWPNIYCYLHDMSEINTEVFRTLKHGATYLYNVFDYFDNENSIVLSAMGRRRVLLSSYTVDLFRRIGFELIGNLVWDKGDIEGKRGFNGGNFSPYYQAPFNCWEHVLVFRKPKVTVRGDGTLMRSKNRVAACATLGGVIRQQPVVKMIRGQNVHGHSAPFPDAIPELLVSRLPRGAVVLDPFAGSLTTGRVAERHGLRSVCIERSEEYCKLGLKMRMKERDAERERRSQLHLFQNFEPSLIEYRPSRWSQ